MIYTVSSKIILYTQGDKKTSRECWVACSWPSRVPANVYFIHPPLGHAKHPHLSSSPAVNRRGWPAATGRFIFCSSRCFLSKNICSLTTKTGVFVLRADHPRWQKFAKGKIWAIKCKNWNPSFSCRSTNSNKPPGHVLQKFGNSGCKKSRFSHQPKHLLQTNYIVELPDAVNGVHSWGVLHLPPWEFPGICISERFLRLR